MVPHNLPQPPTPFVGRQNELAEIAALLSDPACRLLTLLGAGGIGKTRLALQAATEHQSQFAHGVFFVSLAPINSSDLIASALASALQITFSSSEEMSTQIIRYLSKKQVLLLIDNFEHLLEGIGLLSDILQFNPHVKLLVTSRERLNLQEEWVLALKGLPVPDNQAAELLGNYGSVQLFVQRARQVQPGFSLNDNADAVTAICQYVEGMPLGLELAAAWLRAMSCRQIATRVIGNLDFLTTPFRNVPKRHRSLRAVFEQSWNLLSGNEQDALAKLSVFRGGFDLEAAERVSGASLSLLAGLVDKSLIRLNAGGRYDLHELLRQYAADKLTLGETIAAMQRHFDYFLWLAEQAEVHQFGAEQIPWFNRMEVELDNLRLALAWSLQHEQPHAGLALAAALGWFFSERAHWKEGFAWFERLLAASPNLPTTLHSKVLHHAGALAAEFGDMAKAKVLLQHALTIARETNDRWNIAWSLAHLGHFGLHMVPSDALDESVALFREMGDAMGLCHVLFRRAWSARGSHDFPDVRPLLEETASLAKRAGDRITLGWALFLLAEMSVCYDHDLELGKAQYAQSMALFQEAHFSNGVSRALVRLGHLERVTNNLARARTLFHEALRLMQKSPRYNDSMYVHNIVADLAYIAKTQGQFRRAAILLSVVTSYNWNAGSHRFPVINTIPDDAAAVRAQLGEREFAEAWSTGQVMNQGQIIAYCLVSEPQSLEMLQTAQQQVNQFLNEPLTLRELEVINLINTGLSNREIAAQLIVAESTIKRHINHIYSKLAVQSRAEALGRARELGLLW